jgi:hypothetical protein
MRSLFNAAVGFPFLVSALACNSGAIISGSDARKGEPLPTDGATITDGSPGSGGGCGAANLFCDDFENYAVGTITAGMKWQSEVSNGSFSIDTATKRGQKSLKVKTDGNGRALAIINGFAPAGNNFYGRMQLWMTAFPSAPQYAHWTMFEAAGTGPDRIRPIGGQFIPGQGSEQLWGTGADGGATGDWTKWSPTAPAESGKWVCLEWQVEGATNAMHVWIDGVAKPALDVNTQIHGNGNGDFIIPPLTKAWFGWWLYQGNPTPAQFEMYIDDVAIGTTRQGC